MEKKILTKAKAIEILKGQIKGIRKVLATARFGATFTEWRQDTETAIERIFGDKKKVEAFNQIDYAYSAPVSEGEAQQKYEYDLEHAEALLQSFIKEIVTYWPDDISEQPDLNPWGVISSFLFNLSIDDVIDIVSLAGLQVNWSLNAQESYSHNTRKRAYKPRVNTAYSKLNDGDKLRVSWLIAKEIVRRDPDSQAAISERLGPIGWRIDANGLQPGRPDITEMFFPKGVVHDAYVEIRTILRSAAKSLVIIDPYVDGSLLKLLSTCSSPLGVKLLSYNLPADFGLELKLFLKQYPGFAIEVRKTKEFHDRFIIVDDSKCFHIGASIKDAGLRAFMINQLLDAENIRLLSDQHQRSWADAEVYYE